MASVAADVEESEIGFMTSNRCKVSEHNWLLEALSDMKVYAQERELGVVADALQEAFFTIQISLSGQEYDADKPAVAREVKQQSESNLVFLRSHL